MSRASAVVMSGVLFAALCGVGSAEQLPKSGQFAIHSAWKSIGETTPAADGRVYGFGSFWGVTYNDKGAGPLHSGPVVCPYTLEMVKDSGSARGQCSWSDRDGDRIFTDWTGAIAPGGQLEGLNHITGGTGKYAGIQGKAPSLGEHAGGPARRTAVRQRKAHRPGLLERDASRA